MVLLLAAKRERRSEFQARHIRVRDKKHRGAQPSTSRDCCFRIYTFYEEELQDSKELTVNQVRYDVFADYMI